MKLGILASHPIQYQAPLFRELAKRCRLKVYFAHRATPEDQARAGFGVAFDWNVDLTSGYEHAFLKNTAPRPSVDRFFGCRIEALGPELERGRFDALAVMGWALQAYWQAASAAREKGIPVLARSDSQLATARSGLKSLAKRLLFPAVLGCFDGFLAAGSRSRDYLLHYGVPAERVFEVPHCIDAAEFAHASSGGAREALRKEWGVDPDVFIYLFVGKWIERKRPLDLVRAFAPLAADGGTIAAFVGSGVLERELRAEAARLGVAAHVRWVGFRNQRELPGCYAAADALVLPSDSRETWGLVVNEAFACGRPAVVSDAAGCAPDLVVEGRTGVVYPMGDLEKMTQALVDVARWARSAATAVALAEATERRSPVRAAEAFFAAAHAAAERRKKGSR